MANVVHELAGTDRWTDRQSAGLFRFLGAGELMDTEKWAGALHATRALAS